jgi:hypothetical protein
MKEVTIQEDAATLCEIARISMEAVDVIEIMRDNFGHMHIRDSWKKWKEGYADIIVTQ